MVSVLLITILLSVIVGQVNKFIGGAIGAVASAVVADSLERRLLGRSASNR